MAKTLSAYNQVAVDGLYVSPIRLVKIEFSATTLYLCDRSFGDVGSRCIFDGQIYDPLILAWESIEMGPLKYEQDYAGDPGEATFTIDNTVPVGGYDSISVLIDSETSFYADVTISEIFEGASVTADKIAIFAGSIEDVREVATERVVINCASLELSLKNKFIHEICDETNFPNADPDEWGKMLPQIYGTARKVPLVAADVGRITNLPRSITDIDTTITVTSTDGFGSSGSVLIDSEQITYTGLSASAVGGIIEYYLTGCTRGANSTDAVAHRAGAMVGEMQSEYVYIAGSAVKDIKDVYVANIQQPAANYTAYTGQSGDEHGTYGGRAVISFPQWPQIVRATDQEITSGDVETQSREATTVPLGYAKALDPSGYIADYDESTAITFQSAPTGTLSNMYVEYYFSFEVYGEPDMDFDFYIDDVLVGHWDASTTALTQFQSSPLKVAKTSWPTSATKTKSFRRNVDGNMTGVMLIVESAKAYADNATNLDSDLRGGYVDKEATNQPVGAITSQIAVDDSATITFPAAPSGNLSDIEIEISWDLSHFGDLITSTKPCHYYIDSIAVVHVAEDGTYTNLMPSTFTVLKSSWQTSITKTKSTMSQVGRGEALLVTATQSCYSDEVQSGPTLSGNSVADSLIGGLVAIDVDGEQDDGSGTYTGTPNALIERPDHILKHIIIAKCGLTSANINAAKYTTAGAYYATNSYELGFPIMQKPDVRALINKIAHQAKSLEYWEAGEHCLVQFDDVAVTNHSVVAQRVDSRQLWIDSSLRVDIQNTFTARYNRDWSGYADEYQEYRNVIDDSDAASVAKYGVLEGDQVALTYITAQAHAEHILSWIVDEKKDTRGVIEFAGGYWLTQVERGDIIVFDFEVDSYLEQALCGRAVSNHTQFCVIDVVRRGDATIQIQAIQMLPANLLTEAGENITTEAGENIILEKI